MLKSERSTGSTSFWSRNRGWVLCVVIPFVIFFAAGAKIGWWFVEKDAGRWLRDTGQETPDSDFYRAAAVAGGVIGAVGGAVGLGGYGIYRLIRRISKPKV